MQADATCLGPSINEGQAGKRDRAGAGAIFKKEVCHFHRPMHRFHDVGFEFDAHVTALTNQDAFQRFLRRDLTIANEVSEEFHGVVHGCPSFAARGRLEAVRARKVRANAVPHICRWRLRAHCETPSGSQKGFTAGGFAASAKPPAAPQKASNPPRQSVRRGGLLVCWNRDRNPLALWDR